MHLLFVESCESLCCLQFPKHSAQNCLIAKVAVLRQPREPFEQKVDYQQVDYFSSKLLCRLNFIWICIRETLLESTEMYYEQYVEAFRMRKHHWNAFSRIELISMPKYHWNVMNMCKNNFTRNADVRILRNGRWMPFQCRGADFGVVIKEKRR